MAAEAERRESPELHRTLKDPSIRRSLALFRAFLHEQDDPEACYSLLARDAADQVEAYDGAVAGRTVVDVGGGSGYFTEEFRRRGAHAYLFEPDMRGAGAEAARLGGRGGRLSAAAGGRGRRRLLLLQRPGARGRSADLHQRDGAGDAARRADLRVVHQLAVPVGRSRVGALALPRRRAGAGPLQPPYRKAGQAHPRREPLRRAHRNHPAAGARPRRRHGRLGALPLLAVPRAEPSRRRRGCASSPPGISSSSSGGVHHDEHGPGSTPGSRPPRRDHPGPPEGPAVAAVAAGVLGRGVRAVPGRCTPGA